MRLVRRLAWAVPVLALGVAVGLASTVVHAAGALPFALAVAAPVAVLWALPPGWHTRVPFALGWAAVVVYGAQQRPEGDYLVSADVVGYCLLGLALAQLLAAIVTTRPLRPDAPAEEQPPAS